MLVENREFGRVQSSTYVVDAAGRILYAFKGQVRMKICPVCRLQSPLNASECVQCKHVFRTQFAAPPHAAVQPPPVLPVPPPAHPVTVPGVRYDPHSDTFSGTMLLMVKLAMRAVQELGWQIQQANENVGLVTFETGISWGSWSGVTCSLNIDEVGPNIFRVYGTGKQNLRGGQLIAMNIGGEAQGKANAAIERMKRLAI